MTALTHLDPDFGSVFAIEAVNEPIMDAAQTPGYGDCALSLPLSPCTYAHILTHPIFFKLHAVQVNFVKVVRAVELSLGISTPGLSLQKSTGGSNFTASLMNAAQDPTFSGEVAEALAAAVPILLQVAIELGTPTVFTGGGQPLRTSLVTKYVCRLS